MERKCRKQNRKKKERSQANRRPSHPIPFFLSPCAPPGPIGRTGPTAPPHPPSLSLLSLASGPAPSALSSSSLPPSLSLRGIRPLPVSARGPRPSKPPHPLCSVDPRHRFPLLRGPAPSNPRLACQCAAPPQRDPSSSSSLSRVRAKILHRRPIKGVSTHRCPLFWPPAPSRKP